MSARTPDRIDRIWDGIFVAGFIITAAGGAWMVGKASGSYQAAIVASIILTGMCVSFARAVFTTSSDKEEPGAVE